MEKVSDFVNYPGTSDLGALGVWLIIMLFGLASFLTGGLGTVRTGWWAGRKAFAGGRAVGRWLRPAPGELCRAVLEALDNSTVKYHGNLLTCGRVVVIFPARALDDPSVQVEGQPVNECLTPRELRLIQARAERLRGQCQQQEKELARMMHLDRLRGGTA
jgi:hypothetical protein